MFIHMSDEEKQFPRSVKHDKLIQLQGPCAFTESQLKSDLYLLCVLLYVSIGKLGRLIDCLWESIIQKA